MSDSYQRAAHIVRIFTRRVMRFIDRGGAVAEGARLTPQAIVADDVEIRGSNGDRRLYDGVGRYGRRQSDSRPHAPESRRVLVAGKDDAWRLLAAYMFEEAGYTVYAAVDQQEACRSIARLLPDVAVMQMEAPDSLNVPTGPADANTSNIPIVVLTSKLQCIEVQGVRGGGGVIILPEATNIHKVVAEADTLILAAPRAQRMLKRRLVALKELAQHYRTDAAGQERLRQLIDRLQVAVLAVDEKGHCIAASDGAMVLMGYSRPRLLTTSVLHEGRAGTHGADELWQTVLANRPYAGTTTITNHAGERLMVHAAAIAEILPGLHVAAFAAA
jgi:CheY-like chemotaxis protein